MARTSPSTYSPINISSKTFIAGHTGLVGSTILRKLQEKGYKNLIYRTSKELDLRRQEDTERFFEKERPGYVFLAAARVGGILANETYKVEFIYDNILIAANVIHASHKYGVKKLLNLGSSCIYPKFASQPLKEEYLLTGSLELTNEPYAIAKISAIKLCRYYNEQYGTNFLSAMPTNLYGPNDNFNLETSHVLPALIRKFHLAKILSQQDYEAIWHDLERFGNRPSTHPPIHPSPVNQSLITDHLSQFGIFPDRVSLWGTGKPYRECLHVDDLADAVVYLIENYDYTDIGEFINIGTGEDITIQELAEIVREIVGFEGEILWDTSKPDGTPRKLLDISRIRKLGWEPKISLQDGVKKTYRWYLSFRK